MKRSIKNHTRINYCVPFCYLSTSITAPQSQCKNIGQSISDYDQIFCRVMSLKIATALRHQNTIQRLDVNYLAGATD